MFPFTTQTPTPPPSTGGNQPPPPTDCTNDPSAWYCRGFGETYGQSFNGFVEYGNDQDTPFHTTITSLASGTVTDASYQPWGGQIGIRTSDFPNLGSNLIYYEQHLDLIDPGITVGASVQAGQILGLSGGQTSGGYHPSDPKYSTGPHTETGFGAPWINGAQGCSFGAPCNPNSMPVIQAWQQGKITGGSGNPGNPGGPNPIACLICNAMPWIPGCGICTVTAGTPPPPPGGIQGWLWGTLGINPQDILIRAVLILVGSILVIVGLNKVFGTNTSVNISQQAPQLPQMKQKKSKDDKDDKDNDDSEDESDNEDDSTQTENTEESEASTSEEAEMAAAA